MEKVDASPRQDVRIESVFLTVQGHYSSLCKFFITSTRPLWHVKYKAQVQYRGNVEASGVKALVLDNETVSPTEERRKNERQRKEECKASD